MDIAQNPTKCLTSITLLWLRNLPKALVLPNVHMIVCSCHTMGITYYHKYLSLIYQSLLLTQCEDAHIYLAITCRPRVSLCICCVSRVNDETIWEELEKICNANVLSQYYGELKDQQMFARCLDMSTFITCFTSDMLSLLLGQS